MNKPSTTLDYSRRVEKVVAHIAGHLDKALDLERLAAVAAFSPCHFHRIYRYITGETAADTLRRLRLHRAAGELVQEKTPVARIAGRAGYGSVAAFTRAFGAAYGVAPAAYRTRGRLVAPAPSTPDKEMPVYDVEIRTIRPVRLAALRHAGSYMDIGGTFERLFAWGAGRGLLGPQMRSFGIYYDDPGSVPVETLRSDATFVIGDGVNVDGDVRAITLDGGRYAIIQHKGPYAELERAYRWLYRDWLPQSREEAGDRPSFEEYVRVEGPAAGGMADGGGAASALRTKKCPPGANRTGTSGEVMRWMRLTDPAWGLGGKQNLTAPPTASAIVCGEPNCRSDPRHTASSELSTAHRGSPAQLRVLSEVNQRLGGRPRAKPSVSAAVVGHRRRHMAALRSARANRSAGYDGPARSHA